MMCEIYRLYGRDDLMKKRKKTEEEKMKKMEEEKIAIEFFEEEKKTGTAFSSRWYFYRFRLALAAVFMYNAVFCC